MNYLAYLAIDKLTIIVVLCVIVVIFLFFLYFILRFLINTKKYSDRFSVAQKGQDIQHHALFVDLSPKSADIVELAIEVWRINNRIMKAGSGLTDIQRRGLESSLQKFLKFLDKYNIKIVDHTGEKYNEGMNVDVLSFEKDENIKTPLVKETVEPSIICKGHVIKKGKIIVINNL